MRRVSLVVLALAAVLAVLPAASLGPASDLALAARSTLGVGVTSAALGLACGALLAALGLSFGARGRLFATRLAESLGALPTVLVVPLLAAAPLGSPAVRIAVALGLVRAAEAMHLVLLEASGLSAERWIEASLALGARRRDLVRTHLAPRVGPLLGGAAIAGVAAAVPLEVAVGFLGVAPTSGLGGYAAAALAQGRTAPIVVAAVTVAAITASFAFLGRGSRSRPWAGPGRDAHPLRRGAVRLFMHHP